MPTLTIPNTFTADTTAVASQVNANFTAVSTLLNSTLLDSTNIQAGGIATANLAANCVTQAKRAALGQQVSSSCGSFTTSSASAAVTNLTVTITTTGRPVYLALIPDGSVNDSYIGASRTTGTTAYIGLQIDRGGGNTWRFNCGQTVGSSSSFSIYYPVSSVFHIDVPSAGTYTYTVYASSSTATSVAVAYAKLIAYEL